MKRDWHGILLMLAEKRLDTDSECYQTITHNVAESYHFVGSRDALRSHEMPLNM